MTAIDKDQPQPRQQSWRAKRSTRRQQVRRRLVARLGGGLTEAQRGADPMRRQRRRWLAVLARYVSFVLAAIILHSGGVALFLLIAAWDPHVHDPPPVNERIEMRIVDAPPPPPTEAVEANPTRNPTVKPEVAKKAPPPADPVDVPKPAAAEPPPPAETAKPRRRVVGVSFESTVVGGGGPSFAVGNTRMGATDANAAEPDSLEKLDARSRTANRTASRIPTRGARFTKPKRLGNVEPTYPSLLRAQGVEADVVVTITIATDGRVTDVTVIKGAADPAFNTAAVEAAKRQSFAPATRDGEAVSYTLKYTYRFRLDDV